jgi:hypothetical protein
MKYHIKMNKNITTFFATMMPKKKEQRLPHESSFEGEHEKNPKIENLNLDKGYCNEHQRPLKVKVEININPIVSEINYLKLN